MSIVLPQSINYSEQLSALPSDTQSIEIACSPSNGQTFSCIGGGQQIYLDLVSRGFLIPDSMYIRYTAQTTSSTNASAIVGCPVYTPFQRLDVIVGSQTIDTIQNYNILMHMISNCTLDVAQKYGRQTGFGYSTGATANIEDLDGKSVGTSLTYSVSAPLMSVLSNSDKLIPLFAMPSIRVVLTLDSSTNFGTGTVAVGGATPTGNVLTAFNINNFELVYKIVDFGGNVQEMVRGMGDKIYIKSQSFSTASNILPSGSQGYVELIYNQRYASIKALLASFGCSGVQYANRNFDSIDGTNGNAEYSFMLGGVVYPQKPLNTSTNRAGILESLRQAFGSIYDKTNCMAINNTEFTIAATAATTTAITSYQVPGKFYVGVSTEKLGSSLLTGVSTENSPISIRCTLGTATAITHNVMLVVNYDALWEIDIANRQVSLKV